MLLVKLPLRGVLWLGLSLWRRLLGLEAPDVGTGFQLRDVLWVLVIFVARPRGLGSLGNGRAVLGRLLASLVEHVLLVDCAGNLGRLARKIKVFANRLLRGGAAAKRVVIEGVVGVVEAVA